MLFSRMLDLPKALRIDMERTEIGIDAATVSPARRPTYTVTAPQRTPKREPRISARAVSAGRDSVAGTNGLKLIGAAMSVVSPTCCDYGFGFDGSVSGTMEYRP